MPLFDKKPELPRQQFKDILKKTDIKIGQGHLSSSQRAMIEKRDFSRKLGSTISKSEYERTIRDLTSQKMGEQDFSKKYKLTKKIKYLKELEKKE